MKAAPFSQKKLRNYPKLSWKSTTCDAWPALPIDQNRIAGGFATAPFAADLIPKISMNKPYNALTHLLYHTYLGLQILSREGEIPSSPNIS